MHFIYADINTSIDAHFPKRLNARHASNILLGERLTIRSNAMKERGEEEVIKLETNSDNTQSKR